MPTWMITALRLILSGLAVGGAAEIGARAIPGPTESFNFPSDRIGAGDGILGFPHKRRRRRRRALTHQDKDDIAFLAATVGEPTARKFALLLASHTGQR